MGLTHHCGTGVNLSVVLEVRSNALVSNGGIEDAQHQQAHVVHPNLIDLPSCGGTHKLW